MATRPYRDARVLSSGFSMVAAVAVIASRGEEKGNVWKRTKSVRGRCLLPADSAAGNVKQALNSRDSRHNTMFCSVHLAPLRRPPPFDAPLCLYQART